MDGSFQWKEGKRTCRCMDGHPGNTGKVEAPFQTENERKGIGPTSTEMGKHTENSKDERAENRKEASGASKGKEAQGYHKLGRFAHLGLE